MEHLVTNNSVTVRADIW